MRWEIWEILTKRKKIKKRPFRSNGGWDHFGLGSEPKPKKAHWHEKKDGDFEEVVKYVRKGKDFEKV